MKICHLTTVHPRYDNRVFNKECQSLATKYDVILIVSDGKGDETKKGVRIIDIGKAKNLWERMFIKTFIAFNTSRKERADIYHIHDPELLIAALLYRLMGKKIIYDIHEDYRTSVLIKSYLPDWSRKPLSILVGMFEKIAYYLFHTVIAEKYYAERFPDSMPVLNYPEKSELINISSFNPESNILLYTGNITFHRGSQVISKLANFLPEFHFKMVGKCDGEIARDIINIQNRNLEIIGIDRYVPFEEIIDEYKKGALAGIAIFPDNPHYTKKELTKFFEFMAVGLPVVASNFPIWRELIEENGVGVCVNPDDTKEIKEKLNWLKSNHDEAMKMGERGKNLVSTEMNWQRQSENLFLLYEKMV